MPRLKLLGTPTSHFARKVRILLHELTIPFDFETVSSLMQRDAAAYGGNPLLRVPTLIDGDDWIVESDHIARHIVTTRAPHDPLNVLVSRPADLNRLAMLNGIMEYEVIILMAGRGGVADVMAHAYFQKLAQAITASLFWLDQTTDVQREGFDYLDVATICMWQHLAYYKTVGELERFPRLAARVARFSERPSVASTAPQASSKPPAPSSFPRYRRI